jgi:hypothetical protein
MRNHQSFKAFSQIRDGADAGKSITMETSPHRPEIQFMIREGLIADEGPVGDGNHRFRVTAKGRPYIGAAAAIMAESRRPEPA